MTPERLKEIAERAEKATRRNWQRGKAGNCNLVSFDGDDIIGVARVENDNNLNFIAHARTDIPDLLRYITHLEKYQQHLLSCSKWEAIYDALGFGGYMLDDSKPCTCGAEGGSQ